MGFCKSDQKNIPIVGFLTCNDCDVLRAKTGGYRRFTHRTIIPPTMALLRSCPNKDSVALVIRLNSTSLSPNSFLLSLTSATVSEHTCPFVALLDSGSSHCFVDEVFAKKNKLALSKLPSIIPLRLFDGSTRNPIRHKTNIPLTFSTGKTHQTELYITKLDTG